MGRDPVVMLIEGLAWLLEWLKDEPRDRWARRHP